MFKPTCVAFLLFLAMICLHPIIVMADNLAINSLCAIQLIENPQVGRVIVWQHNFDGVFDLAMAPEIKSGFAPITRLSFGGSKEPMCHFPAVAVYKGGDWGWHVAWGSSAKKSLTVVRVDGEAWISSLPKKLASQAADAIVFSEKDGLLVLNYHLSSDEASLTHTMISNDEGRNWDAFDLHQ
jgi:hypothetical protein